MWGRVQRVDLLSRSIALLLLLGFLSLANPPPPRVFVGIGSLCWCLKNYIGNGSQISCSPKKLHFPGSALPYCVTKQADFKACRWGGEMCTSTSQMYKELNQSTKIGADNVDFSVSHKPVVLLWRTRETGISLPLSPFLSDVSYSSQNR